MPLAKALNNVLAAFPPEGKAPVDDRIVFHVNDPAVIESKRLAEASSTKRKPDIVAIFCRVAKMLYEPHAKLQSAGFDDIVCDLSAFRVERKNSCELNRPCKEDDSNRLKWLQVLQSWELKSRKRKISFDEKKKFSGSRFPAGESGIPAEQIPIPERSVQYKVSTFETTESTGDFLCLYLPCFD